MKLIELCGNKGKGIFMKVDDDDYDRMMLSKWYPHLGYAIRVKHVSGNRKNRNQLIEPAHRVIMNLTKGDGNIVDHKNRDRIDNQKSNLRLVNSKQNSWNLKKPNPHGYKGINKQSQNCWGSYLLGKCLGFYKTAFMAAMAHDQEARLVQGEYAVLNFPLLYDYSEVKRSDTHNKFERTSSVRCVSYSNCRRAKKKWRTVYKKRHLGWFMTESEAIVAYENERSKCENTNNTEINAQQPGACL